MSRSEPGRLRSAVAAGHKLKILRRLTARWLVLRLTFELISAYGWLGDASADAVADGGLGCLAMHLWPVAVAIHGAVVVRFA